MANKGLIQSQELQGVINKFSPYLMEFRKRLFLTASVFLIGLIVGFIYNDKIVIYLLNLFSLQGVNIVFTSPFQFINLAIATGVATGITFAFPLILSQVLSFLKPALRTKEYKTVTGFLPFSLFLFLVGFVSGIWMMKWQVEIFLSRSIALGIGNVLDISRLLTVVVITSALLGIAFQTPIILLILLRMKVIKHQQLAKQRPWVYFGSFIFALLLPPDSIIFDIFATLPLVFLFDITLILNKLLERSKAGRRVLEGE